MSLESGDDCWLQFGHQPELQRNPAQRWFTALYTGVRAQARFFFLTPGIRISEYQGKISRHYNRYEMRQGLKSEAEGQGVVSLLTVIQGGDLGNLPDCRVEKIPVKSALKGIAYPDAMAEAVKICICGKEYVVIICHQEVNSPTDLEEADGCMGFGNVIVFERAGEEIGEEIGGTVLHY